MRMIIYDICVHPRVEVAARLGDSLLQGCFKKAANGFKHSLSPLFSSVEVPVLALYKAQSFYFLGHQEFFASWYRCANINFLPGVGCGV